MPYREDHPNGTWSDEEILRESGRWVHVPPAGTRVEDGERLLVLMPAGQGASRVWRSRPDRARAEALILASIEETRAAGGTRLTWHTGDAVSPPFMDDLLTEHGFEKTEALDVLALELGPEPKLPNLHVPPGVRAWPIEDAADLRRAHAIEAEIFPSSTPDEPDPGTYLLGLSALRAPEPRRGYAGPRAFRCLASVHEPEAPRIVATAGAELAGETLRLWGAGTLPEYRGRGAYRALVMERCRYAHALGATLALTKANTASSAPILRAAGFRPVARERRYSIKITAPDPRDPGS